MEDTSINKNYHVVSALDIEELLPFVKKERESLTEKIIEEKRVKEELHKFIRLVNKHTKEKLLYIGEEKKFGKHLERFMFEKGGFLEVIIEPPVSINAHFVNKKRAENFCEGLKKASHLSLPESEVKKLFIDSISLNKPDEMPLSFDKWQIMNSFAGKKTLIYTFIAGAIFLAAAAIQEIIEFVNGQFFNLRVDNIFIDVINSVLIAIFFETIRGFITRAVEKFEDKRK